MSIQVEKIPAHLHQYSVKWIVHDLRNEYVVLLPGQIHV